LKGKSDIKLCYCFKYYPFYTAEDYYTAEKYKYYLRFDSINNLILIYFRNSNHIKYQVKVRSPVVFFRLFTNFLKSMSEKMDKFDEIPYSSDED
jgi:hypothetical protein